MQVINCRGQHSMCQVNYRWQHSFIQESRSHLKLFLPLYLSAVYHDTDYNNYNMYNMTIGIAQLNVFSCTEN